MPRLNYYYLDYLYREIGLTRRDINSVPQSGQGDDACSIIADKKYVQEQLDDLSFEQLKYAVCCLCDKPEVETRKDAVMYLVWMVALNIKEELKWAETMGKELYKVTVMDKKRRITMVAGLHLTALDRKMINAALDAGEEEVRTKRKSLRIEPTDKETEIEQYRLCIWHWRRAVDVEKHAVKGRLYHAEITNPDGHEYPFTLDIVTVL